MSSGGLSETAGASANHFNLGSDESVDQYFKNVMPVLASVVRSSNLLPSSEQYDFYSTYKEFVDLMQVESSRALEVLSKILRQNGLRSAAFLGTNSSEMDADDKFESLIDINDQLTERIGTRLDEASGIRKPAQVELLVVQNSQAASTTPSKEKQTAPSPVASWNDSKANLEKKTPTSYRLLAARFIQRPQTKFSDKIDNSDLPFYPKLTYKPNALISLKDSLMVSETNDGKVSAAPNPYKYEIENFAYLNSQLEAVYTPQIPKSIRESGPVTYIETVEALDKLCDELLNVTELAVDLEAHSYRSFQGLTCLMQLSTRSHDYIIDTLALRSFMHRLNLIFTDHKIVKVFHGAESDIDWLQRDFGLYVVNMFDTYQASKVLSFSRHSLAFLLKHFCQVEADKQYQLADWRIRPLPQEMINYAREDTHYLLYIYDQMKNALLQKGNVQKNLLISVLNKSRLVCSKVYIKPTLSDEEFNQFYTRSRKAFNNRQLFALRKLYEWRFKLAQQEDESTAYILPNHIMLQICEVLPREPSGVLACCTPIPPLVRQHLHSIHSIVQEAREQPLTTSQSIRIEARNQAKETKTFLNTLHDTEAEREDVELPQCTLKIGQACEKTKPAWTFLAAPLADKIAETVKKIKESFYSPLKNYDPVKFIDYFALYQQNGLKRSAASMSSVSNMDSTMNTTLESSTDETPVKQLKVDNESAADVDEEVSEDIEEGQIVESKSTEIKKKKKVDNRKLQKKLPLRLRPASNPEKKLVQPASDFQPYDYSKASYEEFKTPPVPKPKFDKKKGNKGRWRENSEKSLTYKQ